MPTLMFRAIFLDAIFPFVSAEHPNATTPTTSWEPQPLRRGTVELIRSCLLTLILCVWTAVHMNVPARAVTKTRKIVNKASWALFTIFAPELVVYSAYVQYAQARGLQRGLKLIAEQSPAKVRRNLPLIVSLKPLFLTEM